MIAGPDLPKLPPLLLRSGWQAIRVRLKGINTVRYPAADGSTTTYFYHRATGQRLQGEPGTAEFQASFEEAGRATSQGRGADTVSWLIRQYCDPLQWKKLAESTRAIGALNLKAAEAKWGTTPLKHVENPRSRPLFLRWHDSLAETQPRAADNKLAALARVFSWGYDRGRVTHNPIATSEPAYGNSRAEMIWLPDHVTALEAAAGPEIELALVLAPHTGQRQGDLLRLPWSAYDGHAITMRQGKGGRKVWLPATVALKDALDIAPRNHDAYEGRRHGLDDERLPSRVEGGVNRSRHQRRPSFPRPARDGRDDAFGGWMHAAGSCDHHGPYAGLGEQDPGGLSVANEGAGTERDREARCTSQER